MCPEELKIQNGDSERKVQAKEGGLILPVERHQVKLWARMNLSEKASREEKENKDRALGKGGRMSQCLKFMNHVLIS